MSDNPTSGPRPGRDDPDHRLTIIVRATTSHSLTCDVSIDPIATIHQLKRELAAANKANVPAERQRLVHAGAVLRDGLRVCDYNIRAGDTVFLARNARNTSDVSPPPSIAQAMATEAAIAEMVDTEADDALIHGVPNSNGHPSYNLTESYAGLRGQSGTPDSNSQVRGPKCVSPCVSLPSGVLTKSLSAARRSPREFATDQG